MDRLPQPKPAEPEPDADAAPQRRWPRRLRRIGWILVAVVAALTLIYEVVLPQIAQGQLLANGSDAPPIQLQDITGRSVNVIPDAGARPVVVNFFDTTCSHCQAEVPQLCQFAADHPDVHVVAVESRDHSAGQIAQFASQYGSGCLTHDGVQLLVDPGSHVSGAYHVLDTPTLYLLKQGKVAMSGLGEPAISAAANALLQ